jgi:ATP/maltotriose-dependent transcriptional regulator MalT
LVVIEDLHLVSDSDWLVPFFSRLLPLLPSEVHVLITSRSLPPAPLWRMRSKQSLVVIDEARCAFTRRRRSSCLKVMDSPANRRALRSIIRTAAPPRLDESAAAQVRTTCVSGDLIVLAFFVWPLAHAGGSDKFAWRLRVRQSNRFTANLPAGGRDAGPQRVNSDNTQRQTLMAPAKPRSRGPKTRLRPTTRHRSPKCPEHASNFFLRTKLLPPRPAPELLSRARLTDRLLANLSYPLTLVTANAGSGKTTLVADFLRTHKRQFVWYQLDHTDADPSVFLGYLAFGIRQQVPNFGEAFFSYLQEGAGELAQHPERAVDVFLNEVLDRVEQQLILVLDDYHHLGQDTAVHAVLDRLLAYLPDVLHVIIISREMPPLALGRLRTHSPLSNIDRADLLFTDEETQELFARFLIWNSRAEQLAEYRERTHGWITALQLVRQVAHRQVISSREDQAELPDLVEVLRQSERDIFDYFAEEVFADEDEDVRKLLLQVSLLDRIELDACTALYAGSNCSRVLPNLVRRNVFITVASDRRGEEYRLHPLFQNFLRRRLRSEIGARGVAAEHQRCAAYF